MSLWIVVLKHLSIASIRYQWLPMTTNVYQCLHWLHSDYILETFWLQSGYFCATFWLRSDYILPTFLNISYLYRRHKQNCIYPQLFCSKFLVFRKYAWHTMSSIIEYIPPLGPIGPTDRQTKLHISMIVWLQIRFLKIYFAHNILYNWMYPTFGPDRAHRYKLNSTYPSCLASKPVSTSSMG